MSKIIAYTKAKATLTPIEKIGQLFMPAAFINDTEEEIKALENLIKKNHIGSLCFFHSRASTATNFESKKKVQYHKNSITRYQNVAKYPLLISIDAEWGLAMRIEDTPKYPYTITLGAIKNNNDLVYAIGKQIAIDCKIAGIHWNLAPVVDINNNPNNPVIGYRSFGENKELVIQKATAFIRGSKSEHILTSIKHFPGHGDTDIDSHLGLPIITKTKKELLENELSPFKEIINSGVDSVMVGHLAVPALSNEQNIPATLSKNIIKGVLRKEFGFNGVIISDALNMHSVSKLYPTKGELEWLAFNAGNDILCFAENIPEGINFILKNASIKQIEESFKRIWKLKESIFISDNKTENSCSKLKINESLIKNIAQESITLHKGDTEKIKSFKEEGFSGATIGKNIDSLFFKSIHTEMPYKNIMILKKHLINKKNILISLYPSNVKPKNNFGFSEKEILIVNELLNTKNVILYVFGNPYVLNTFATENAKAIVLIYQDDKKFQEHASQHFLGYVYAKGKLPVTIKNN